MAQDERPPENLAEAAGVVSTGEGYDQVSSPLLLDFVTEIIERYPTVVLQHISTKMNVTLDIIKLGGEPS